MPDRALLPLMVAAAGGFICGVIAAITEAYGSTVVVLGLIVGLVVFATGVASVIKTPGEESERRIVGVLRGAVAVACFGFLYIGLFHALRDGNMMGIIAIAIAAFFGLLLTRFRVRDREDLQHG